MPEELLGSFGDNIRRLRTALNMSQDELAERCGYTDRSSIAKIESGKADIPQKKIKLFADALNVPASTLLEKRLLDNANSEEVQKAMDLYEKYKNALPQVQEIVENLLKSSRPDP